MSAVKLYYPQPPTQRTSRDSSSQVRKVVVDQKDEEIYKARMRDSLLKNLLGTIAKASKTEEQKKSILIHEGEKLLAKYEEENDKKRRTRLLLSEQKNSENIITSNEERYPFVKSLHKDFRKKRTKENYNPVSRVVNTTFEESPRLSFYKQVRTNVPEPIIFVKRITEQQPPQLSVKKRYSIPIKDIVAAENKANVAAAARVNITTARGRNQSLSSYRRLKEMTADSQPSSRAPTSKRHRIVPINEAGAPPLRQSYGNRALEKELTLQQAKNDDIGGWGVDDIMDVGRWNSPTNFNNKDWTNASPN